MWADFTLQILFATAIVTVVYVRWLFLRTSTNDSVDHYYWILAARAYREQCGFPVRISDKFLLEDERQFYPPGFGLLLALFPDNFLRSSRSVIIVIGIDAATLGILVSFALSIGLPMESVIILVAIYGLAPVLVTYNTQLTSRGLGNLFLVVKLLAEVAAVSNTGVTAAGLWFIAIVATAAVIMTHKMTTQFMLILWPLWPFALDASDPAWIAMLIPVFGLALAILITGPEFQRMQWLAHLDFIKFWSRNWRQLGAHQFRQSSIYGNPREFSSTTFHKQGMRGVLHHATFIVGYLPAVVVLPLTLLFSPAPPLWVLTWLATAMIVALATLYISKLKCLGGGHLYIFNAVPPAALWWAMLCGQFNAMVFAVLGVAMLGTMVSLVLGWRKRQGRFKDNPESHSNLIAKLNTFPPGRVAVYPFTASDRIALETPHAVLWGGHSFGLNQLEPYFPVVQQSLGVGFNRYAVTYAVLDTEWWPEGELIFSQETGDSDPEQLKAWRFYKVGKNSNAELCRFRA